MCGSLAGIIILAMLNPFAVEKDLFARLATIQHSLHTIRVSIAASVLANHIPGYLNDNGFIARCHHLIQGKQIGNRLYICKVCGREFDEGRKLGGHVSRAHKESESSLSFLEEEEREEEEREEKEEKKSGEKVKLRKRRSQRVGGDVK